MKRSTAFSILVWAMGCFWLFAGCAGQKAMVEKGDPSKSFFRDQVTYPYKVTYGLATANDGTGWEIGYMDVAPLFTINPKVLVLIHGRAFSGAYFGDIIKQARSRGFRVIDILTGT